MKPPTSKTEFHAPGAYMAPERKLSDAEKAHMVNLAHGAQAAALRAREAAEDALRRAREAEEAANKLAEFTIRLVTGAGTEDLLPKETK